LLSRCVGASPDGRFKLEHADPELVLCAPHISTRHNRVNDLRLSPPGPPGAFSCFMTVSLILFGIQLGLTLFALLRERSTDSRFENDKLIYKS
jgi:hypothetical protein